MNRLARIGVATGALLVLCAPGWALSPESTQRLEELRSRLDARHPRAAEGASPTVTVELFSGRPNPAWPLTAIEAVQLAERVKRLAPAATLEPAAAPLGYRGIVVTAGRAGALPFDRLSVRDGRGRMHTSQGDRRFQDSGRAFERWLFDTGRGRLPDALYGTARSAARLR